MRELHQLIKSLTPNEKKYFRRYRLKDAQKETSQAEMLFDVLDEIADFDEEKILFRLKRLKLNKQVADTKNYLFEILTDTLVWYHKEDAAEFGSFYLLSKIRLLEDRGLEDEAAKFAEKLFPRVLENGSFVEKWNVLGKNINHASNEFLAHKKSNYADITTWLDKRHDLLQQMQRCHEYDQLLIEQLGVMRKAMQARNDDDIQLLNSIFQNPIIQNHTSATSTDAQFVFHTIRLHHFQIFQQWDEFYNEALQLVNRIKQNQPGTFEKMRILWAYAQLTQASYFMGNWAQLELSLNELQNIEVDNQTEKIARFTYYAQLTITLFDYKKDKQQLTATLEETVQNLGKFKNRLRPDIRLAITITCVSAYVEYGNYSRAVDLSEDFLLNYDADIRLDALLMLYIYQFISHLELGNIVYVNNIIQNVYRYFLRNEYKGELENTLLKIFKKISEMADSASHKEELEKLNHALDNADAPNRQHLTLVPIVKSFLLAKMNGKKMHEWAEIQRQIVK